MQKEENMNKLGIFMNFWEKNWAADHAKYIRKASDIGFDILEFQAQPLLGMTNARMDEIRNTAAEYGIELTGDTPRSDFTDIEIPSVIIKSPKIYTRIRTG